MHDPDPNLWAGGYVFVVQGVAPGGNLRDYLGAYLSGAAHTVAGGTHSAANMDSTPVTASDLIDDRVADLPLIHLKDAPPGVPRDRIALLRALAPQVKQSAQAWLPILPGETVTDSHIAVLGKKWHSIPAGTLVYTRETNRGTMSFCLLGNRIDLDSGQITADPPPRAPTPKLVPRAMVSIDPTTGTIIDAALTIAQFAGFALGPAGLILSGGAAVLQLIFGKLMSSQQEPLSTVVANAVRDVSVDLQLQNADATIGTDYDWLRAHYNAAWVSDSPPNDDDYTRFRNDLENKLDSDTGIIQVVAVLMEPSFQERGFSLFILGGSLVLLMYKVAVIIESSDKRVVDAFQFNALMQKLAEYIGNATTTMASIDKKIADRLGQITQPERTYQSYCGNMGACASKGFWTWKDGSDWHSYEDTAGGKCGSQTIEHRDEAQRDRDSHYASVQADLNKQYYGGDPDKIRRSVQQWQAMQANFAQYAPKS